MISFPSLTMKQVNDCLVIIDMKGTFLGRVTFKLTSYKLDDKYFNSTHQEVLQWRSTLFWVSRQHGTHQTVLYWRTTKFWVSRQCVDHWRTISYEHDHLTWNWFNTSLLHLLVASPLVVKTSESSSTGPIILQMKVSTSSYWPHWRMISYMNIEYDTLSERASTSWRMNSYKIVLLLARS